MNHIKIDITPNELYFVLIILAVSLISLISFGAGNWAKSYFPNSFNLTKGPIIRMPFVEWPSRMYRDFEKILLLNKTISKLFIHDPSHIKLLRLIKQKEVVPEGCEVTETSIEDIKVISYVWKGISNDKFHGIKYNEHEIPSYLQIDKDWEFKYWKNENIEIICNKCKQKMNLYYAHQILQSKNKENQIFTSCDKCQRNIGLQSLMYSCSQNCIKYCTTCSAKENQIQKANSFFESEDLSKYNENIMYEDAETLEISHHFQNFLVPLKEKKKNHPRGVIISIHGGGYVRLSANSIAAQCAQLSRLTSMECVSVEYRKAPEHPLPEPIQDVVKVYEYYLKKYDNDSKKIVFQGNSAGGGMVLLILQYLRDTNRPLPLCAICISPYTDLTGTSTSLYYNKSYDILLPYSLNGYLSMQHPGNYIVGNWKIETSDNLFLLNCLSKIQRRNIQNIEGYYENTISKLQKNSSKKMFGNHYFCDTLNENKDHNSEKNMSKKKLQNRRENFYKILKTLNDKCEFKTEKEEHQKMLENYKRLDDHHYSPLFGEFFGLCPIYFTVGQHEVLLHDTLKCIQKCKMNNVDCEFEILSYGCHTYPVYSDQFPEANEANARIGVFINKNYSKMYSNNDNKKL